jgi:hypothetical protein
LNIKVAADVVAKLPQRTGRRAVRFDIRDGCCSANCGLTEKPQVFQWIKRLLSTHPSKQDAAHPNISHETDPVPESLKVYVERRKQEILENYERQVAAGTLSSTSNEEALDDPNEDLKRARNLMIQAQELFAMGKVEAAMASIKEAGRIEKKCASR